MATKSMRIIRPGRYGTRDLKADDVYEATGPEARLYSKLGWMEESRAAKAAPVTVQGAQVHDPRPAASTKPAAKRAPRKKAAAKKK